jgi:hypothetical protein
MLFFCCLRRTGRCGGWTNTRCQLLLQYRQRFSYTVHGSSPSFGIPQKEILLFASPDVMGLAKHIHGNCDTKWIFHSDCLDGTYRKYIADALKRRPHFLHASVAPRCLYEQEYKKHHVDEFTQMRCKHHSMERVMRTLGSLTDSNGTVHRWL